MQLDTLTVEQLKLSDWSAIVFKHWSFGVKSDFRMLTVVGVDRITLYMTLGPCAAGVD